MRQVVLNIHGIGTPTRSLESDEATYWISLEQFRIAVALALDALARGHAKVEFTFDDGNISDLTIGARILNDADLRAKFFVLAGRIDTPGFLSSANIRLLQDMGHVIGSHGWGHVDWTALDELGQVREFRDARAHIANVCGRSVNEAGIPFGRYNRTVVRSLQAEEYQAIYSSDGGPAYKDAYPIARTSLTAAMGHSDIAAIIADRPHIKHRVRRAVVSRLKQLL